MVPVISSSPSLLPHAYLTRCCALELGSSGSEISMSRFAGLVLLSPFPSVLSLDSMHKMHLSGPDLFDSTRVSSHLVSHLL